MRKVAVFEGIINGEMFDNVQAYNERMTELVNSHVENIQASSRTSIKMVEDEVTPEDPELTFYPYFEQNDQKYLDNLITTDDVVNENNLNEVRRLLDKNYLHITNQLYSPDVDLNTKEDYLQDVRNIISCLKHDLTDNDYAMARVNTRLESAQAEFEKAEANFNTIIAKCNTDNSVLRAAKPVIESILDFYRRIEADAMHCIVEHRSAQFVGEEDSTDKCCKCNSEPCNCDVECNCREIIPQEEKPIEHYYDSILRACGLK